MFNGKKVKERRMCVTWPKKKDASLALYMYIQHTSDTNDLKATTNTIRKC